jgi:hypothetical protein
MLSSGGRYEAVGQGDHDQGGAYSNAPHDNQRRDQPYGGGGGGPYAQGGASNYAAQQQQGYGQQQGQGAFSTNPAGAGYGNMSGGVGSMGTAPDPQRGMGGGYGPAPVAVNTTGSLKNMPTTTGMNIVSFAAACFVVLGSCLCGFILFFSGSFVDWLNVTYIALFGIIMALVDTPFFKTIKFISEAKQAIMKYINFLTRVTGKGICFVFLGSALLSALIQNVTGVFLDAMGVLMSSFVVLVGLACIVIGITKSHKLWKAQKHLQGSLELRYNEFARSFPGQDGGLTPDEFNSLSYNYADKIQWEEPDLKLIFNAISSTPAWRQQANGTYEAGKVSFTDLSVWVHGGWVLL